MTFTVDMAASPLLGPNGGNTTPKKAQDALLAALQKPANEAAIKTATGASKRTVTEDAVALARAPTGSGPRHVEFSPYTTASAPSARRRATSCFHLM